MCGGRHVARGNYGPAADVIENLPLSSIYAKSVRTWQTWQTWHCSSLSPTGHQESLLFLTRLQTEYVGRGKIYSLYNIPFS